jgi:hypothetical protein
VLSVFDPAIARRLVSFIPTRIVELPVQSDVWKAIVMWLDQWDEVIQLIGAESLWCIKVCQTCHELVTMLGLTYFLQIHTGAGGLEGLRKALSATVRIHALGFHRA